MLNQAYLKGISKDKYIKELGGVPVDIDTALSGVRAIIHYEGFGGIRFEENVMEHKELGRQVLYDAGLLD